MIAEHRARLAFAGAVTPAELWQRQTARLKVAGVDPARTLLAVSLCCDETNSHWLSPPPPLLGPFVLGGLAGLPTAGRTGMGAFVEHVPDGGGGLLVYGPHLGMSDHGYCGLLQRPFQDVESVCCGALALAVKRLREAAIEGRAYHPSADPLDTGQVVLERFLAPHAEELLAADEPLREAAEIAFRLIHEQVAVLIESARADVPLLAVGGIVINTSTGHDLFQVRHEGQAGF